MKTKSKNNAIVTVSLPETQNACGENVRLPVSPSGMTKKQTSEKQEPNISQDFAVYDCLSFGKRSIIDRVLREYISRLLLFL